MEVLIGGICTVVVYDLVGQILPAAVLDSEDTAMNKTKASFTFSLHSIRGRQTISQKKKYSVFVVGLLF